MGWVGIVRISVVLLSGAAGAYLGVGALRDVSSDVIAACSILAAFLVPVMLLLATVLSAGRLSRSLFDELASALDARQKSARRLFAGYVFVIFLFLALKLSTHFSGLPWQETASRLSGGLAGLAFAGVLMWTLKFMATLRDLQSLRHELLRQEMEAEDMKTALAAPANLDLPPTYPGSTPIQQNNSY
jgi:NADH:ubiquinone oxidoreductase subunit 3 (subunit A)